MQRAAERVILVAFGVALRQFISPSTSLSTTASRTASTSSLHERFDTPPDDTPSRPNVVLTLLDDAGAGDAAALGHPLLQTPHIDKFAAGAITFSQAYAGAPNCSPSRAALLTGRSSYRTGVYDFLSKSSGSMHLDRREKTIANVLRNQAGYATV